MAAETTAVARTDLGQLRVQGLDYAYTLQGWLKGVNPAMGGTLTNGTDTTETFPTSPDVFGFSLHYYKGDYRSIYHNPQATSVLGALGTDAAPLYNGNIAAMGVNIPKLGGTKVYNYHYDQLNRLTAMDMYNGLTPTAGTFSPISVSDYRERVSYDPNGNILTYNRHGDAARLSMDSLSYTYKPTTNQLDRVADAATDNASYTDLKQGQAAGNYQYDAIGNLVSDAKDTLTSVNWTVYGKISDLTKAGKVIRYAYDAAGNRTLKLTTTDSTAYVRDAQGNVLSVYNRKAGAGTPVVQTELHLYGSSRLGMALQHTAVDTMVPLNTLFGWATKSSFTRGEKLFELSNHLGNVLATVSDRRQQVSAGGVTMDSYTADVQSAQDYYPFGMQMPGRTFLNGNSYKYGFNGKEKDDDLKGGGNSYDYGARIYDPRLSRWFSTDPVNKAWLSPYQYASGNPVNLADPDGGDEIHFHYITIRKTVPIRGTDGKFHEATLAQTYRYSQVIKDNNADRFFVHRGAVGTTPTTIEFYPNAAEKTKSGVTTSSYLFGTITLKDNDRESLHKIIGDFPEIKGQVLGAEFSVPGDYSQHAQNRAAWQNFYSEHAYLQEKEEELETKKNFALGVLTTAASELAIGLIAEGLQVPAVMKGRLGKASTRSQIDQIATELESRGYTITGGGGRLPEEYLSPVGGGRKGGSYLDITATHPKYGTLRINTVDVLKDGVTPTAREATNAARIRTQIKQGEHLLLIPKR